MARQLGEYLDGDRRVFELPVKVKGTEFDRRAWELLAGVPYGETTTYGDLAHGLGPERIRGTSVRRSAATRCAS